MDKETRPDHLHCRTLQVDCDHNGNHPIPSVHPHSHTLDKTNSDRASDMVKYDDDTDTQSADTDEESHEPSTKVSDNVFLEVQPTIDTETQKEWSASKEEGLQERKSSIMCLSPPQSLRKQTFEFPPLTSRRPSVGNGRRPSIKTNSSGEVTEDNRGTDSQDNAHKEDTPHVQMSSTEKRMAILKNRFSSKNLFNVKRQNTTNLSDVYHGRSDHSPDGLRKAMSGMALSHQRSLPSSRPVTSFSTAHGRQIGRLLPRATTSSGCRLSRYRNQNFSTVDNAFMGPRQPRSRRELEKLSQMRIDPFRGDVLEGEHAEQWEPIGDVHQDLLDRLRRHGPVLQQRVSSFLKDLENFNRRGHKTGLEQILDIT